MTVIWCKTHEASSEAYIVRCYFALWSDAIDRCEMREMELRDPNLQIEGQTTLEVGL